MDTTQPEPSVMPAGPPQFTAEHRESWLEGYGFALRNLTTPGVLADAHRAAMGEDVGAPPAPASPNRPGVNHVAPMPAAPPPPLMLAIDHAADRLDRLEHTLGILRDRVDTVAQPSQPSPMMDAADAADVGAPASIATNRVRGLAARADRLADEVLDLAHRLDT